MEFLNELRRLGIDDAAINSVWRLFSGNPLYIPKFKKFGDLSERNKLIKAEFTGKNHKQLAVKYDLSYSRICRILSKKQ